jgi:AbrB family looped-hinge helix DNA binding protein
MALAQSKLTAQGQISIPAQIRRKLGLVPGSVIQWEEHDGEIVVRRATRYTSQEIHKILFPDGPPTPHSLDELKEGVGQAIQEKYAGLKRARR